MEDLLSKAESRTHDDDDDEASPEIKTHLVTNSSHGRMGSSISSSQKGANSVECPANLVRMSWKEGKVQSPSGQEWQVMPSICSQTQL